jgi:hypothetical protein
MNQNEGGETESGITTPIMRGPFHHDFSGGPSRAGTPLGSSQTATPQGGHVNVMVTTTDTIVMVDIPTYDTIDTLRNRVISMASQGTVVQILNHFSENAKRIINLNLGMRDHTHVDDWQTLPNDILWKVLKEIFPKDQKADNQKLGDFIQGVTSQSTWVGLFNFLDQNKLVMQFSDVQAQLQGLTWSPADEEQAVKTMLLAIPSPWLREEVRKQKITKIDGFIGAVLKEQHRTKEAIAEVVRREAFKLSDVQHPRKASREGMSDNSASDHKKQKLPDQCNSCGGRGHSFGKCAYRKAGHPDHNPSEEIPWHLSEKGIAWQKKGASNIPGNKQLDGFRFDGTKLAAFMK